MSERRPPKIKKFPAAKQKRMDGLLDKNSEGKITPAEADALNKLVDEAHALMAANTKRLADFAKAEGMLPPPGAVPVTVTVWVQPQTPRADS